MPTVLHIDGDESDGDAKPIMGLEPFSDAPFPELSMSVEITGILSSDGFELLSRTYNGERTH